MISIGITGQAGFVGTHLYNKLCAYSDQFIVHPFKDDFFSDEDVLRDYVARCDAIVHLAAIMRHPEKGVVYNIDMQLTHKLLNAIKAAGTHPTLLFASSIQENDGTEYGLYKYETRQLFEAWAKEHNEGCATFVFVNMFGPLAKPNYSSFIATFCYRLTHGDQPKVLVDNTVPLRYVDDVMDEIVPVILDSCNNKTIQTYKVEPEWRVKVSDILATLKYFKETYFDRGEQPELRSRLEELLFHTFKSYINYEL